MDIDSGDMPCRKNSDSECRSIDYCFCQIFDVSFSIEEYMPLFIMCKEGMNND